MVMIAEEIGQLAEEAHVIECAEHLLQRFNKISDDPGLDELKTLRDWAIGRNLHPCIAERLKDAWATLWELCDSIEGAVIDLTVEAQLSLPSDQDDLFS